MEAQSTKTRQFKYESVAVHPDGTVDKKVAYNLVPTVGLNDGISKRYSATSYTSAFYIGLLSATPTLAASDTMASHGGWTEVAAYSSPTTRPALVLGTPSGGSADNSASTVSFTMNASGTTGGFFISTDSTISGTTGILDSEAAFTGGNQAYVSGTVITVTVTVTETSA